MSSGEAQKGAANIRKIVIGILSILALIIIFQNMQVVNIQLLFWQVSMSRILLLFVCLLIGAVVGLLSYPLLFKNRRESKQSPNALS